MLKADSSGQVFVGGRDKTLLVLNNDFTIKEKYLLDSPPSYLLFNGSGLLCLEMGIMDPNDKSIGKLVELSRVTKNSITIFDFLKWFDLNRNQRGRAGPSARRVRSSASRFR